MTSIPNPNPIQKLDILSLSHRTSVKIIGNSFTSEIPQTHVFK